MKSQTPPLFLLILMFITFNNSHAEESKLIIESLLNTGNELFMKGGISETSQIKRIVIGAGNLKKGSDFPISNYNYSSGGGNMINLTISEKELMAFLIKCK